MRHIRYILVIGILLVSGIFLNLNDGRSSKGNIFYNLGKEINGYYFFQDVKMLDKVYDALEANSLIFREYRDADESRFFLTVVYHKNDRWGAHDPIVCYKSQGWEIIEKDNVTEIKKDGQIFPINRFIVKKNSSLNLVYYYWFSTKRITHSRNQQMLDMVVNGLINGYTESGFVRFSIAINTITDDDTISKLNNFVVTFTKRLNITLFQKQF